MIDTHAHLLPEEYEDLSNLIEEIKNCGITYVIDIASDLASSKEVIYLSEKYPLLKASIGIHPHQAGELKPEALLELKSLSSKESVVAIGEIGLDYHYKFHPPSVQKECFISQLKLAKEAGLPVIIHSREAFLDLIEILSKNPVSGVIHCFNGNITEAEAFLSSGFYLGIGGMVTFPKLRELHIAVKEIPLDRILLETDSPYLAPIPFRGRKNNPTYLKFIAQKIAEIKNEPLEKIINITTENALRLFKKLKPQDTS